LSGQAPLRAAERIKFKLAVIVYRALHNTAPQYLSDMLRRLADIPSRSRLPATSLSAHHASLLSGNARLLQLVRDFGTVFRTILLRHNDYQRSEETEHLSISAILPGHYTVVSDCLRHGSSSSYIFYFRPPLKIPIYLFLSTIKTLI